jgi:glycosyltransferase involved in cell wall biosynthesis
MKIVIVSSYFPPHLGGLEIVAFNHSRLLAERGHNVTVLTSSVEAQEVSGIQNGVDVQRIKAINFFDKKFGVPFPFFFLGFIRAAFRAVKNADVVHIHDVFYVSSFYAALAARYYKKPIVLMQHVEMIKHPSRAVMLAQRLVFATTGAYIFKHASKIITLNDRVDAFLIAQGVDRAKLVALPNGVDTELFCPVTVEQKLQNKRELGLDTSKKAVLFVGRFVPKKGFDKLLAAKSDKYQLVFAGGESPEPADSRAVFLGKMSQADLVKVYQAADIFALPSEGEGFPLSVQEAMASGLPIITTNDAGYARYAFNRDLFMLIDAPTSETIKTAIESIVIDEQTLARMGDYSRDYVVKNFSWRFVISALEEIYRTVQK